MIDAFKDFYILEDILKKHYGLSIYITKSSIVPDSYNLAIHSEKFRANFYASSIEEV